MMAFGKDGDGIKMAKSQRLLEIFLRKGASYAGYVFRSVEIQMDLTGG